MTDEELWDIRTQLAESVASRCHHIIHADDPIMAVAVLLQVIGSDLSGQQKSMLEEYAKNVLNGTLQLQSKFEDATTTMLKTIQAAMTQEVESRVGQVILAGRQQLQEMIRDEFNRMLAAQRAGNSSARFIKQAAQITLAAAALAFMGCLVAFIVLTMK